jgi:FAD/FMN-containing dehydrogenase
MDADLHDALPPGRLITDPQILAGHETDITGRFHGRAVALARPRDRAEVAALVAACAAVGQPLVAQGGNTGLVGGGVPRDGEIVLSLTALDWVGEVDRASDQLAAGAGATLEQVQDAARRATLEFPLDFPSRGSATIGGGIATDAGGALALRHGTMRRRVVGLEVVLADGSTISRMDGLMKDNAGFDIPALLVGSEGTLGIITAARLQLEPSAGRRLAAMFGVGDLEEAIALLEQLRTVPGLEAVDFLDEACMRLVRERLALRAPLAGEHPLYVIAQFAGDRDVTAELADSLAALSFEPDVVVAEGIADRQRLWAYREAINESIRELGIPHKLDVAVPIAQLPSFVAATADAVGDARLFNYGHLGDGNVHVNFLGPEPDDDRIDARILGIACDLGGTISAEHGVGLAKRRYLSLCRSEADIAAMQALKRALDPDGILAPGRILEA